MMITTVNLKNNGCEFNYTVSIPEKYYNLILSGVEHPLPLIIYLHGAGERGDKVEHLERFGIPRLVKDGKEINAVALCPQCPAGLVWNNMVRELKQLIDSVAEKYQIKKDRICITGSSMGGCGTLEMVMTYPSFFSAAAPVASQGLSWRAGRMRGTPLYLYHGDKDSAVLFENSVMTYNEVKKYGGTVELYPLKDMEHNDGIEYSYRQTDLIEKLLKARRTDFSYIPDCCEEFY